MNATQLCASTATIAPVVFSAFKSFAKTANRGSLTVQHTNPVANIIKSLLKSTVEGYESSRDFLPFVQSFVRESDQSPENLGECLFHYIQHGTLPDGLI